MATTKMSNLQIEISKLKYENEGFKEAISRLTNEYNDYRNECDEICKEYEETIQLLSDSLDKTKFENTKLNKEKEKYKIDYEKSVKELEKLRDKNKEKLKEIEILTNKYEKLESQFNSSNKKETTLKSKLVTLETDNDHYLNKIHQYEEEVTDLKDSLENAIENLITTQTEFEEYKTNKEEEIERLKQSLQEEKDNINALIKKNKYISNINIINENNENEIGINEERKSSWNEGNYNNEDIKDQEKFSSKKIKSLINEEDEREHELMLEIGRARSNRAMTMQKISYNFGEVISNLRQRRERLSIFNKKIKQDSGQIR